MLSHRARARSVPLSALLRLLAVNPPEKDKGRYPRIVERKGESPPQYIDWDSEEGEDESDADRGPKNH